VCEFVINERLRHPIRRRADLICDSESWVGRCGICWRSRCESGGAEHLCVVPSWTHVLGN